MTGRAAAVFLISSTTLFAGTQSPFQAGTELVALYVSVVNDRGQPITGVAKDDFVLLDNGRPQDITVFSNEPQPFALVVMLDYSGSMASHRRTIASAAETLVAHLLPDDRARVGAFGRMGTDPVTRILLDPPAFSTDRDNLRLVLRNHADVLTGGGSPIWAAVDRGLDALAGQPIRRSLVLLSDGFGSDEDVGFGDAPVQKVEFDQIARRVTETSTIVYGLGFVNRGTFTSVVPQPRQTAPQAKTLRSDVPREGASITSVIDAVLAAAEPQPSPPSSPALTPAPVPLIVRPHPRMRTLSEASGGRYVEVDGAADFNSVFANVVDDLHSQYLLGFVPASPDGSVHTIDVRVRVPNATAQTRTSYLAPQR